MESQTTTLPEQVEKKKNELAYAAGWLGIAGVLLYLVGLGITLTSKGFSPFLPTIAAFAILAGFILGIIALVQMRKHPGQKGKGLAITGIVIGASLLCIAPLFAIFSLVSMQVVRGIPTPTIATW